MNRPTIDFITLGCSKNLVDTERLMYRLHTMGFDCRHDPENPKGEIAIINTCGFIGDAKEESVETILAFAERKKKGRKRLQKLYVMGCLSQRYFSDLKQEIPEVDGWYGKFDYIKILDTLQTLYPMPICSSPIGYERVLTTPKHYAYLKISEGCNRMCSYCAIPLITGRHTSRPMEEIIAEAHWLAEQGVKELNVIAQDLSSYGLDIYKGHRLPELVRELAKTDGIEWIRLHYAYPTDFPRELLQVMAEEKKVCKYLDIALQHCTDNMLSLMKRHITRKEQDELIRDIRQAVPGICLRTTLMVGHPGETEKDFEELKAWVREMRFERMGAFAYSEEDGTYAARHYKDDIPQEVKEKRLAELMAIQEEISSEIMKEKRGAVIRVIIDRKEGDYTIGRTEQDSPEVDCEVLVKSSKKLKVGEMYDVRIVHTEAFDIYAETID